MTTSYHGKSPDKYLSDNILAPKNPMLLLLSLLEDPRLKKIAGKSALHKAFLQAIGIPQEGKELAVKNFSGLLDTRDAKVVKVMKDLQKAGFGRFFSGRRGRPSRLIWSWGSTSELSAPRSRSRQAPSPRRPGPSGVMDDAPLQSLKRPQDESDGLHRIEYRLRKDFSVELTLPADISAEEAERLSKFILALPANA